MGNVDSGHYAGETGMNSTMPKRGRRADRRGERDGHDVDLRARIFFDLRPSHASVCCFLTVAQTQEYVKFDMCHTPNPDQLLFRIVPRRAWPIFFAGLVYSLMAIFLPVSASAQLGKPEGLYYKSWAIIIGVENYLLAPKNPGAIEDAKAVAQSFRRLGFEEVLELYDK